jgi:glycosyltransferase involved in cell wall biosynthesis
MRNRIPLIDVIVPSYNNLTELKKCIQGFHKQTIQDFRMLVCVDGSTDGTHEYLIRLRSPFPVKMLSHKNGRHCGRSAARNLALPFIKAPYLVIIDSDIVPAADLLENHVQLLIRKNCISLGEVQYTNASRNIWADYIQTRGKNKFNDMDMLPPQVVTTGNLAMKAGFFLGVHGQDEQMTHYGGEDTELAYRIHKAYNLPVIYNKCCVGYSFMKKDLSYALKQMQEFGSVNLPYIRKIHPEFNRLFRVDLMESGWFRHIFLRFIFIEPMRKFCMALVPAVCAPVRRFLIHFLVIFHICAGYHKFINNCRETIP